MLKRNGYLITVVTITTALWEFYRLSTCNKVAVCKTNAHNRTYGDTTTRKYRFTFINVGTHTHTHIYSDALSFLGICKALVACARLYFDNRLGMCSLFDLHPFHSHSLFQSHFLFSTSLLLCLSYPSTLIPFSAPG